MCPIKEGTLMDMMYMPEALNAAIMLMEADPTKPVSYTHLDVYKRQPQRTFRRRTATHRYRTCRAQFSGYYPGRRADRKSRCV